MRRTLGLHIVPSLALLSALGQAQTTTRVSVSSNGTQGNLECTLDSEPAISADGRFVAFASKASNLVAVDTNNADDVFVHDRLSGATTRVSVDSNGIEANGISDHLGMSADGRFVTFRSAASNLVPSDTNTHTDIFVRDLQTNATTRVSVDSSGAQGNGSCEYPAISSDGRYVAFGSWAPNLVLGDSNGWADVFLHDRQTGATTLVSVATGGAQGDSLSLGPRFSEDGRFVVFISWASTLVSGDTNATVDVFVRDLQALTTERVSVSSSGGEGNPFGMNLSLGISSDGRYVAFGCNADNLVPGDTNGDYDVFVRDRQTQVTERVSLDSNGLQLNGDSAGPTMSADGRLVSFVSDSTVLVPGDTNQQSDVFVLDRATHATTLRSRTSTGGMGNGGSSPGTLTPDGRSLVFVTSGTNFVPGDTNNVRDIFVRDECTHSAIRYCTAKTNSLGCTSAIEAQGCPSASAPAGFVVSAWPMRNQKPAVLIHGFTGQNATPFLGGILCVQGPLSRTPFASSGGSPAGVNDCSGAYSLDMNSFARGALGGTPAPELSLPGTTVNCQWFGRDPGFAPPGNTTHSDALEYVVGS